jgi:hypothetical protein
MLINGLPGHSTVSDSAVKKLWLRIDEQFHFMPDRDFFYTVVEETAQRNSFHPVTLRKLTGLSSTVRASSTTTTRPP